ncbi:MAG TPA: glycosyl hydrolase [bacterium]|nr:glycosyl hydrolase [bacterium]
MAQQLSHGIYPGGVTGEEDDCTESDVAAYEQHAGHHAAWVYFSHNWYRDRAFPRATVQWLRARGSVPYIRLMLRSDADEDHAEPLFTLARIIAGNFDADLQAWAIAARDSGGPLLVEFGTEMNGGWFPWNGRWQGGGTTGGYGDPHLPDGPEQFRDAYRHIIACCRKAGARNIYWVFHVNAEDDPAADWNRFEQYYPGEAWIDLLGVSVYGAQTPQDEACPPFAPRFAAAYARLTALAPALPVLLAEFGTAQRQPGEQEAWAAAALAEITSGRYPRLAGFAWWNERWENDDDPAHDTTMRLQDNPALARVFRQHLQQPAVVDCLPTGLTPDGAPRP